jgi:hypothetical protein
MSPFRRELLRWARTVHLYVTLFALALVLFFSVTGFMLNHEDWFLPADSFGRTQEGKIPTELLAEPADKLAVVELLRKDYEAVGLVDSETLDTDDDPIRIVFKRPGTEVEALIKRESGETEVTIRSRGISAILLDLHRGKSTGKVWSLVIDATCVVLLILAATGLIMWSSLRGRGRFSLLVLVGGTMLSVLVVLRYAL